MQNFSTEQDKYSIQQGILLESLPTIDREVQIFLAFRLVIIIH